VPTISDVAARAGVSTATVSRALNGKATVDPDLAVRVRQAAEELGYQPNGPARNLRRQEAAVVALIISDVENPFFTAIARGVEDVAHEVGYSVVLCNSDESAEKENRYIDVAIQERVDQRAEADQARDGLRGGGSAAPRAGERRRTGRHQAGGEAGDRALDSPGLSKDRLYHRSVRSPYCG